MTIRNNKKSYAQKIDAWVSENGTGIFFKVVFWIIITLLSVTTYFLTGYFSKAEKASEKMEKFSESVNQFGTAVNKLTYVVDKVQEDNAKLNQRVQKLEDWKEQHQEEVKTFYKEYDLKKKQR